MAMADGKTGKRKKKAEEKKNWGGRLGKFETNWGSLDFARPNKLGVISNLINVFFQFLSLLEIPCFF